MLSHSPNPRPPHLLTPSTVVGQVTFNDRAATALLEGYVDDQVRSWLDGRNESDLTRYEVAFFDEDSLSEVSCLVALFSDGRLLKSWESADDPRLALKRSLDNLTASA